MISKTDLLVKIAYLSLGANLGEPLTTLQQAIEQIAKQPQIKLLKQSAFYQSAPIDSTGADYVNAVVQIQTGLAPLDLLLAMQAIENRHGRTRPSHNAPRTLDIDVLLYAQQIIELPQLLIPHPRMWQRAFVLLPLAEIAPELVNQQQLKQVAQQKIQRLVTK